MRANAMDMIMYNVKEVAEMQAHAELINGNLLIEDKTTVTHNLVVSEIASALRDYISSKGGNCKVFTENVAIYCNEILKDSQNFFLPDVMVVCDKDGIREDGIYTAPVFVAEVSSESTRKYDYSDKMLVYRDMGVAEYWIIDIQRKSVYTYLKESQFIPNAYLYPTVLTSATYPGLTIDLSEYMQ